MSEPKNNQKFSAMVQVQSAISSCRLGNANPSRYCHQVLVKNSPLSSLLHEIQQFSYEPVIPALQHLSDCEKTQE